MPTLVDPEASDLEKLLAVFKTLKGSLGSIDNLLESFGLANLPTAQRYGIMFGILTFFCTVTAVITLLVLGGSFKRIAEQSKDPDSVTVPSTYQARAGRPLLYENLLEARERMMKENYPDNKTEGPTNLTKMLLNVNPGVMDVCSSIIDKDEKKRTSVRKNVPPGFLENYALAYRMCQDKPGGPALSGIPEARFEAYARSYASCGLATTTAYRRSYARMYEAVSCKSHALEKKFTDHYNGRPQDIIGRTVRLEALDVDRHLQDLFAITCGNVYNENKAFDPNEVWAFWNCGPFKTQDQMRQSWVFQRAANEAAFAIVESLTDCIIGVVILTKDDPENLNIQIEPPIVKPSSSGTVEQIEACFLLMDRLFALGYRRIQLALDVQDAGNKRLPGRLGFTQEGMIPKHMIVKEANRDSNIYGMLNSDWDKGARSFLFKKLHGAAAQRRDESNNKQEGEVEEQNEFLKAEKEVE